MQPSKTLTAEQIYEHLFAGKRLTISLPSFSAYETLRVALHRLHAVSKSLGTNTEPLVAIFYKDRCLAIYQLGSVQRGSVSFEIV
jgi:hypothetical protein